MTHANNTAADTGNVTQQSDIAQGIVLLSFSAAWCAPCRALQPRVAETVQSFGGRIRLVRVDIDTMTDMAEKYGVRAVPTLVLLLNGAEIGRSNGLVSTARLIEFIEDRIDENA